MYHNGNSICALSQVFSVNILVNFVAMILDWRNKFGINFSFLFVQLEPWTIDVNIGDVTIPVMRLAQLSAFDVRK